MNEGWGMYKGFSLIELMVVIAVVGLLSAIAVPAYTEHMDKARLNSIMSVADAWKNKALLHYTSTGRFPDARQLGLDSADDIHLDDLSIFNGLVSAMGITGYTTSYICGGVTKYAGFMSISLDHTKFSSTLSSDISLAYGESSTGMFLTACTVPDIMTPCALTTADSSFFDALCPP